MLSYITGGCVAIWLNLFWCTSQHVIWSTFDCHWNWVLSVDTGYFVYNHCLGDDRVFCMPCIAALKHITGAAHNVCYIYAAHTSSV